MKLSDIGTLSRGKSKHRPRNDKILYGGKYPFIQTSDIKNANHILQSYEQTYNETGLKQSKLWSKNTICITIAANIADSAILGFDACFPDSVIGLTVNDKIANYHYVEYLLQYYKKIIQKQSNGTSQENINLETFEQVLFDIPSLKEQDNISHVLYTLDKKITLNNKINNELEQMAKTLYDYWFVQFDFPDEKGRPYKSANGKMVYNEVLKREIPVGWKVKNIKDLCNVVTGKEDANFATSNGKYAFFTCGDDVLKCDSYAFEGKAVLVAGNGNFNVKYYEGCFNAYQRTYVLIPKNTNYIGVMYKSLIDSIKLFTQGANGSIVKFITKGDIENTKVIIPDNTNLLYSLNLCLSKIDTLKNETKHLAYLRDFLLPLLMNGQVSVQS